MGSGKRDLRDLTYNGLSQSCGKVLKRDIGVGLKGGRSRGRVGRKKTILGKQDLHRENRVSFVCECRDGYLHTKPGSRPQKVGRLRLPSDEILIRSYQSFEVLYVFMS